jgi:hypothetical protein
MKDATAIGSYSTKTQMQSRVLASEMDLVRVSLTSPLQHNKTYFWMGITSNGATGSGSAVPVTKHRVTCWHLK